GDRRAARHQRGDRARPREEHVREAERARPHRGAGRGVEEGNHSDELRATGRGLWTIGLEATAGDLRSSGSANCLSRHRSRLDLLEAHGPWPIAHGLLHGFGATCATHVALGPPSAETFIRGPSTLPRYAVVPTVNEISSPARRPFSIGSFARVPDRNWNFCSS